MMSPTIEKPSRRVFNVRLKSETVEVVADTICEPNGGDSPSHYVLKREGEIVGKFWRDDVSGWWIDDKSE